MYSLKHAYMYALMHACAHIKLAKKKDESDTVTEGFFMQSSSVKLALVTR